jgi:tyrosine-protein phosphatase SIW14
VVSLRQDDDERARVTAAGMRYVEIPMTIGPFGAPVPTEAQAQAFLEAVTDPTGRPAYVHCKHGRDRTGVMVALYRVEVSRWTGEEAVREAEKRGLRPQYKSYRRWIRERVPSAMLPADPTSKEAQP